MAVKPTPQETFVRREVPRMEICWACRYHVFAGTETCPHCGSDVEIAAREYAAKLDEVRRLKEELESILERAQKKLVKKKKKAAPKKKKKR